MKHLFTILMLSVLFACNSDKSNKTETEVHKTTESPSATEKSLVKPAKTNTLSTVLTDVKTLSQLEGQNPIVAFQNMAKLEAQKVISISNENINSALDTAKQYKHCVITTADHTLVSITDLTNCKPSGSWGACMPFASGYIKKGDLIYQEDYCNNIIGLPDSQNRTMYLFN
ncbi:MAG: hypothetical protein BM564_01725 [Bacteroidetes bacterium MedPE-SWsnd-G2]|nr:MAG: hypothetical protein BM564_01725 [Bacteroidetes bacterium MedPE-SWsnd-G2]